MCLGVFSGGILVKHRHCKAGRVIRTDTCPWRHAMEGRHERTNGRRHGKGMTQGWGGGGGTIRAHAPCFSMNLSACGFRFIHACLVVVLFGLSVFVPVLCLVCCFSVRWPYAVAVAFSVARWYGWRVWRWKVSLRVCNGVVPQDGGAWVKGQGGVAPVAG